MVLNIFNTREGVEERSPYQYDYDRMWYERNFGANIVDQTDNVNPMCFEYYSRSTLGPRVVLCFPLYLMADGVPWWASDGRVM